MEISFYGKAQEIAHVAVPSDLFRKLAHSEFSRIGMSKSTSLTLDGEKVRLPLVRLSVKTRTTLERFLICFIVDAVDALIGRFGTRPTGKDIEPGFIELKCLIQILRLVADKDSIFLQRTS